MTTIGEVLQKLPEYFIFDKAKGVNTKVQLHITGDEDEFWLVTINNEQCTVKQKEEPQAQMKVIAESAVLLNILNGTQEITAAYMRGDVIFEGNVFKAMKFLNYFDLPDEFAGKIPFS